MKKLKENFDCVDGDYIDNPDRKINVKKWLIDNYILDKSDFDNYQFNKPNFRDIEPVDLNVIEGD